MKPLYFMWVPEHSGFGFNRKLLIMLLVRGIPTKWVFRIGPLHVIRGDNRKYGGEE